MAGQIRMTPDTMRTRANEYRTERDNVQNVISKMDSLLSQLREEWEGASVEAYDAKFQELRPSFVDAQNLIDEIARSLDQTADTLEQTDRDIASAFK